MYRAIIFFLIANVFVILSNIPLFISIRRTPQDTVFPLYHSNTPQDYNVYLSVITLGKNGYWLNRDAFTSEDTTPGIFYFFYIVIGKIARVFHLWPPVAYHLARFISVELFLIATYFFCIAIVGKRLGFLAALLTLIGTIAPPFLFNENGAFLSYLPWWGEMDAIKRLDGLPHHVFGQAMLLFSLILIISCIRKKQSRFLILASLSLIIQGIILPPSMFPVIFGLPITWMILFILKNRSEKPVLLKSLRAEIRVSNVRYLIILLSAALPLLLSKWQTQQGYPWILWSTWEINMWNKQVTNFNTAFLLSYGSMFLVALPALTTIVRAQRPERIFLFVWTFLPLLLLPFMTTLGLGKIRLIHSIPFIPVGILAAITLFEDIQKRSVRLILFVLLIFSSLSITGYLLFIRIRQVQQSPVYANIFIPNSIWHALAYIDTQAPNDAVVISDEYIGNILPAYTPVKSYFGHINQTLEFFEKQGNVGRFFSGAFTEEEARRFTTANRIQYAYYGPDEQSLGHGPLAYSFLKEVFHEGNITVYEVR